MKQVAVRARSRSVASIARSGKNFGTLQQALAAAGCVQGVVGTFLCCVVFGWGGPRGGNVPSLLWGIDSQVVAAHLLPSDRRASRRTRVSAVWLGWPRCG
jgi:hypothetical protein